MARMRVRSAPPDLEHWQKWPHEWRNAVGTTPGLDALRDRLELLVIEYAQYMRQHADMLPMDAPQHRAIMREAKRQKGVLTAAVDLVDSYLDRTYLATTESRRRIKPHDPKIALDPPLPAKTERRLRDARAVLQEQERHLSERMELIRRLSPKRGSKGDEAMRLLLQWVADACLDSGIHFTDYKDGRAARILSAVLSCVSWAPNLDPDSLRRYARICRDLQAGR